MSKPEPAHYKTVNWKKDNAALKASGMDTSMQWHAIPTHRWGRPPTSSDAAIQFCLTLKGLFRLALRQTIGLAQSLLRLATLDWPVPDYNTIGRRQKQLEVLIPARASTGGLHLLVDSTGIVTPSYLTLSQAIVHRPSVGISVCL